MSTPRYVAFVGRPEYGEADSLATPPITGIWFAGRRPSHVSASIPLLQEVAFDGTFCSAHGQLCQQVSRDAINPLTKEACTMGDQCDHWVDRFVALWNRPYGEGIPFEIRGTPTVEVAAPEAAQTILDAPEDQIVDAPPPALDPNDVPKATVPDGTF